MQYGAINKLERNLEGHSYTVFKVGKEISEIKDVSIESEQRQIHVEYEIHYRNGKIVQLIGGIFTITRNTVG